MPHTIQSRSSATFKRKILKDLCNTSIKVEGGVVAAKMNSDDLKKWLPYWLFVAVSVIALTNRLLPDGRDDADPKGQLISPELAMFAVLLCAICLVLRTVKQTM
ncbi:uncharacterized protein LOC133883194 isoform X2 [Phragmites australis]|uniref:uncharacterized protein LOC133883194 isoform X2 n=1 Tax=Phragmites australis TaxID=29695 RepID=UPI002D777659|nr:uncharacterized protein LOC133883194 isoform X2 [Phragmites australis]